MSNNREFQIMKGPELNKFIKHMYNSKKTCPVVVWGAPGIGKTEIIGQIAEEEGIDFMRIEPATFSDEGDFLGMPDEKDGRTRNCPPDWVPKEGTSGILLFDDFNRAQPHIIKAMMNILLFGQNSAWKLPKGWKIMLTANPDNGKNDVTPLDGAIMTRAAHVEMVFNKEAWALWAERAKLDTRGIAFVLANPELASQGDICNARTLTKMIYALSEIEDWKKEMSFVQQIARAHCGDEVATAFTSFVTDFLQHLPDPEAINNGISQADIIKAVRPDGKNGEVRNDIATIMTVRLVAWLTANYKQVNVKNIQQFLKYEEIPGELKLLALREFQASRKEELIAIIRDKTLIEVVTGAM